MMNFLLRVLLVVAGLIFAASLIVVMLVLLIAWGLRAVWCKLTGRPVLPFAMRMNPRAGFEQVFKQAGQSAQENTPDRVKPARRELGDVTDVEPKG